MPILASFVYPLGARFSPQRQQIRAFAIGWQPDAIAIQSGQTTILREFSFGGYKLVFRFKDWVWYWDNRSLHLDDLFDDVYAVAPDNTIVNAGTIIVNWQFIPQWFCPTIVIISPAMVDHYYFQRFPPATRPYWNPQRDKLPPTPFWYP